ncbi:MAG: hypothetical protein HY881_19885 [Deltaproteobacteria bacterium]|nr:hypothetical protein [Deltaproteobacteria bacterium]
MQCNRAKIYNRHADFPAKKVPMDITDFFDARDIWPDTNSDGYPDDLGLTLSVDPGVADSNIWAGILNLTARLSFETTAFNLPIVCTRGKRGKKRSRMTLVIMAPGKYPPGFRDEPKESHIWQPHPDAAYLVGDSALEMGRMLNRLAFGASKTPPSSPHSPALSIALLNLAGESGIYGTNPLPHFVPQGPGRVQGSNRHASGGDRAL